MEFKKFLKSLLLIFFIVLLVWSPLLYFNVIVDPYGVFFKSDIKYSRTANKRLIKIKHLLKHPDRYDSFIFGSSRVNYIDPEKLISGKFYNMTYSGGLPFEHLQDIRYLIKKGVKIRNIIVGIDFYSLLRNPVNTGTNLVRKKYPENIREKFEFYKTYLLNKPGFDFIRKVNGMNNMKKKSNIEKGIVIGIEDSVLLANIENHKSKQIFNYPYTEPAKYVNINENLNPIAGLVEIAKENNISLKVFINPIYRLTYLNTNFQNYFSALKKLAEITDFYDFGGINAITNNSFFFYENSHYSSAASDLIIKRLENPEISPWISNFGNHVTKQNIDLHIDMLQNQVKQFFEATNLYNRYKPPCEIDTFKKAEEIENHKIEYINGIDQLRDTVIITSQLLFVQGIAENKKQQQIFIWIDDKYFEAVFEDSLKSPGNKSNRVWNSVIPVHQIGPGSHQLGLLSVYDDMYATSVNYQIKITGAGNRISGIRQLGQIDKDANLHIEGLNTFSDRIYVKKSSGQLLYFQGWATGPDYKNPAGGLLARARNLAYLSQFAFPSPDLVYRYKNPDLRNAGWGLKFPASELNDGENEIILNVLNVESNAVYKTTRKIAVNVISENNKNYLVNLIQSKSPTKYHLDKINDQPISQDSGQVAVISDSFIRLTGWAVDEPAEKSASAVVVKIDKKQFICEYGLPRPDVATYLGNINYTNSGWNVGISTGIFEKGKHNIQIFIISNDGKKFFIAPQEFTVII